MLSLPPAQLPTTASVEGCDEVRSDFQICWQWGAGGGVPPFDADSAAAQQLMLDLAGGIVPVPTGVAVTKAVALQVYLLFQQQRLKHLSFKHVYLVLASFSLGYRVNSAQTAAVERLRRFFSSKENGARVGLAEDYKERVKKRSRDEILKQLTVPEARRHLMQLYDHEPLNFSFAEVAGGGGGGDPGGSGTATTAPAPTQPAPGPLDVRTRTLATQLTLMAAGAHSASTSFGRAATRSSRQAGLAAEMLLALPKHRA